MRAILIALAALSVPAHAADQFDLVCKAPNAEVRYRLDLARGEYCFGQCDRVKKIAQITSGTITFFDVRPALKTGETAHNRVDRATGIWEYYNFSPRFPRATQDIKGQCDPAPFSGFPAAKF